MSKATKICSKCKRGLPETATKCSCGCTEIFDKKECDDILNEYRRSSEKEKYQMYQNEKYRRILEFVLSEEEVQIIKIYKNTSNRKYKSYVSISSPVSQPTPTPQNIPKCPICGSTNLSKITIAQKAGKIALFGIFGMGDNGKTWKCNNCGSKF